MLKSSWLCLFVDTLYTYGGLTPQTHSCMRFCRPPRKDCLMRKWPQRSFNVKACLRSLMIRRTSQKSGRTFYVVVGVLRGPFLILALCVRPSVRRSGEALLICTRRLLSSRARLAGPPSNTVAVFSKYLASLGSHERRDCLVPSFGTWGETTWNLAAAAEFICDEKYKCAYQM